MSKATDLHWAIARSFARVEEIAESHSVEGDNKRMERVMELLFNPAERNVDIWLDAFESAELDTEYADDSFAEFNLIPEHNRDWQVRVIMATQLAAAQAQADAEIMLLDMWAALEKGSKEMLAQSDKMSENELNAASDGPGKQGFLAAKEERKRAKEEAEDSKDAQSPNTI